MKPHPIPIALALLVTAASCSAQVTSPEHECDLQHQECHAACDSAGCQNGCGVRHGACLDAIAQPEVTTRIDVHSCVRVIRSAEAVPFEINGAPFVQSNCLSFTVVDDAGVDLVTKGAYVWTLPPGQAGVCTCD